jgi:hypothetical protein
MLFKKEETLHSLSKTLPECVESPLVFSVFTVSGGEGETPLEERVCTDCFIKHALKFDFKIESLLFLSETLQSL